MLKKDSSYLYVISKYLLLFSPVALFLGTSVIDAAMSFITIFFLIYSVRNKDFSWAKIPWIKTALIFNLYLVIRSVFAEDIVLALDPTIFWWRFPVFGAAVFYWLFKNNPKLKKQFLMVNVFLIFFLLLNNVSFYLIGEKAYIGVIDHLYITRWPLRIPKLGLLLKIMIFPVVLWLISKAYDFVKTKDKKLKNYFTAFILIISVLLILLNVMLTGARMAYLMTLFGAVLIFILYKPLRKLGLVIIPLFAVLISIVYVVNDNLRERQFETILNKAKHFSSVSHGVLMNSSLYFYKSNPLFGIGPRHLRKVGVGEQCSFITNECKPYSKEKYQHSHNNYLEVLTEAGAIGLFLFLWFLVTVFKPIWKNYQILNAIDVGILIALIMRLWPLQFMASIYHSWTGYPLFIMIAWLLSNIEDKDKKKN